MTTFHLDGDQRLSATDNRGRDKRTGLCGLDSLPRVTDDEATELMAHHLTLAAVYYKNTPDDHPGLVAEVRRLMSRDQPPGFESDALCGALAFLAAICTYHDKLRLEQGD